MKVLEIAHHRNGVGGEPFYAVAFTEGSQSFIAAVFDAPGHVAVLSPEIKGVAFGHNSWRGDRFESGLREAIASWEADREAAYR